MSVSNISLAALSLAFIPVVAVLALLFVWRERGEAKTATYGVARMLLQLLAVGYVLNFIFATDSSLIVAGVLSIMLAAASWIALRTIAEQRSKLLLPAMLAIGLTSVLVLMLVTQAVLRVGPWYDPRVLLPLGGMVLSACMNAVSLAAERVESELAAGAHPQSARRQALKTALIPVTNSMFAVGLVSLPGMMTGQILAGVSPLIAARYQIVVMCMLFGASGLAAAAYLLLHGRFAQPRA
jgi:putative ABC transport system permease protein